MKPKSLALLVLASTAACSGGASLFSQPSPIASQQHAHGRARVSIHVPRHHRRAQYISPSTKSISIAVATYSTVVANLTASSPGCSSGSSGLQCTVYVTSPIGRTPFTVKTFDALGATGKTLSSTTVTLDVKSGSTTPLNVTLGGIAASLKVVPPAVPQVTGTLAAGFTLYGQKPQSFTIVPVDADDNIMIGAGAPAVSATSPPAAQHLTVTPPAGSSTAWGVTSSYAARNPLTALAATVTAVATPVPGSGGSQVSATLNFQLYEPWVYVSDKTGTVPIQVFDEQGNVIATTATNPWYNIPSPTGIVYDTHNDWLYISGNGDNIVYVDDVEGNDVYPSGSPWQNLAGPLGIAYVPTNNFIYVGNGGIPSVPANVTFYNENGVQQTGSNAFANPGYPIGLAYDAANGYIYDATGGITSPAVIAYNPAGMPQSLSGAFPGVVEALGVGVDSHTGNLLVGSYGTTTTVKVFDAQGNAVSTTGAFPGLSYPTGILYDPYDGLIYVADGLTPGIHVYDEQGNAQSITFNGTFSSPFGITVVP